MHLPGQSLLWTNSCTYLLFVIRHICYSNKRHTAIDRVTRIPFKRAQRQILRTRASAEVIEADVQQDEQPPAAEVPQAPQEGGERTQQRRDGDRERRRPPGGGGGRRPRKEQIYQINDLSPGMEVDGVVVSLALWALSEGETVLETEVTSGNSWYNQLRVLPSCRSASPRTAPSATSAATRTRSSTSPS